MKNPLTVKPILVVAAILSALSANGQSSALQTIPEKVEITSTSLENTEDSSTDSTFQFEKLTFLTSMCMGTCPVIKLNIDSVGKVELSATYYNESEEDKSGNFKGKLNAAAYDKLIKLLAESNIRTLDMKPQLLCCDAAEKTIILHQNGERYYFKTMFEPNTLRELIKFLYSVPSSPDLKRTDESFRFER